jgi:hypothetical protein
MMGAEQVGHGGRGINAPDLGVAPQLWAVGYVSYLRIHET